MPLFPSIVVELVLSFAFATAYLRDSFWTLERWSLASLVQELVGSTLAARAGESASPIRTSLTTRIFLSRVLLRGSLAGFFLVPGWNVPIDIQ